MSSFLVSARKYRPTTFEEVFGQKHVTHTLLSAIKQHKIAQAMLFCGPRGVGKTTCARIFAHQINHFSRDTSSGESNKLNIFELDAASNNSVENIRHLIEQIRFPPQQGTHKIYIIDEVHMLSSQAFNAFLKTLEEPPPYAVFILATTEKQKVLPTVLSRCQIFHFKRLSVQDTVSCLQDICQKEKLEASEEVLYHIGRKADGSLRDALSLFDMLITFSEGKALTYKLLEEHLDVLDHEYFFTLSQYLSQSKLSESLLLLEQVVAKGLDLHRIILDWSEYLRNILLFKDAKTEQILQLSLEERQLYQKWQACFTSSFLIFALDVLNQGEQNFKHSHYPRLHIEILLMKISQGQDVKQPIKHQEHTPTSAPSRSSSTTVEKKPSSTELPPTPSLTLNSTKPAYRDQEKLQQLSKKHSFLRNIGTRFSLEGEL